MWTPEWGAKYVDQARTWLGTPFMHGQRVKGRGVDCWGLIRCVAVEMGLDVRDVRDYGPKQDHIRRLLAWFDDYADPIDVDAVLPGDIVIYRYTGMPQHCAVWTGPDRILYATPAGRGIAVETAVMHELIGNEFRAYRWRVA